MTAKNEISKKGQRLAKGDPQLGAFSNTMSQKAYVEFNKKLIRAPQPNIARVQALCTLLTLAIGRMDDGLLVFIADLCSPYPMEQFGELSTKSYLRKFFVNGFEGCEMLVESPICMLGNVFISSFNNSVTLNAKIWI